MSSNNLDANGYAFIIAACGVVVMQMLTAVLSHLREQARFRREQEAHFKLDAVADNVKTIEKSTNGMTAALLELTDKEASARGFMEGFAHGDSGRREREAADKLLSDMVIPPQEEADG